MGVWEIAGVKVKGLYKTYEVAGNPVPVLKNMELELDASHITVILGRSGCGKTTFLRVVSGMEGYESGSVELDETIKTGIVFQEPRLMPWLNAWKNITFGLKKKEIEKDYIEELIRMTGLTGFEHAYPAQLSGGMQQRVALARALAYRASYLLMDEPFAALDHFTRQTMQQELLRIHREKGMGVLFVTHSIDEALTLANRILILEDGRIAEDYQIGDHSSPRDLLSPDMIEIKRKIVERIEGGKRL